MRLDDSVSVLRNDDEESLNDVAMLRRCDRQRIGGIGRKGECCRKFASHAGAGARVRRDIAREI